MVHNQCGDSARVDDEIRKSSELPVIKRGTKEWDDAVEIIRNSRRSNFRVETASDANALLKEARGNMNHYKQYSYEKIKYKKGYETHNIKNARELTVGNDLQHIKWREGKSRGHIFYDKPN
ncbi:hypothetical protein Clocl_2702 [Acetivibrio clariflavus DSM 19732]|uniref:Uncharacterized protein n=1 Tax=Acetivibrio clariflavus (strain DSM 19732 / NBRC 101661 / EBR45) TaxID=720554 RepID=G8M2A2_ACECE|nr:hypothetical protein Clocl_2702 [Acetivibrio clariflavus DSM 19732]